MADLQLSAFSRQLQKNQSAKLDKLFDFLGDFNTYIHRTLFRLINADRFRWAA